MNVLRYIQNHANKILFIFNYQYMYMHDSETKKKRIIALKNAEKLFSKTVYISRWHLWPEWQKQHQFKSFIHSHGQTKRRVNKSRIGQLGMLGFEVIYNDDSIQSSGVDWNSCVVQDSRVGKCESEDTHVRQFSSCSPSQTVVWSSNPPTYLWYLRYHCSNFQSSNIGGSAFIPLKIYLKIFSL